MAEKTHRKKKAGKKAVKRKNAESKKKSDGDAGNDRKQNPKAFIFASRGKAKLQRLRTAEKDQKRMHVPVADTLADAAPPFVVLVHGPPGVGKSLLIRCLVKHYTKHTINNIQGPITLVSAKNRRLTFVECPQDMNAMIDAAKYADLVLLLVDGAFGFEMETFEFLNCLQVHGFPKVMGVLTHLDGFKDNKQLKNTKKALKHRFWTEIYQGAKLFYLSGLKNGRYLNREVHNLARFISVMKFRPLTWRMSHPYLLVDRLEDTTAVESIRVNPKCDRTVCLYGYVRGCNWREGTRVHIAGVGDHTVYDLSVLPDPCPAPDAVKKRSLNDKERILYAPFSDVGAVNFDKDAMYIDIPDWKVQFSSAGALGSGGCVGVDEGEAMVRGLKATQMGVDEKLQRSRIQLFEGGSLLRGDEMHTTTLVGGEDGKVGSEEEDGFDDEDEERGADEEEEEEEEDEDQEEEDGTGGFPAVREGMPHGVLVQHNGRSRRRAIFDTALEAASDDESDGDDGDESDEGDDHAKTGNGYEHDDDDEEEEKDEEEDDDEEEGLGSAARWKKNLIERAASIFSNRAADLSRFIYNTTAVVPKDGKQGQNSHLTQDDGVISDGDDDGDLFRPRCVNSPEEHSAMLSGVDVEDSCVVPVGEDRLSQWDDVEVREAIRNRFVTGDWSAAKARAREGPGEEDEGEDEVFGDFEDLETGAKFSGSGDAVTDAALKAMKSAAEEEIKAKKLAKKQSFDAAYDEGGTQGVESGVGDKEGDDAAGQEEETYYDAMKKDLNERAARTRSALDALDPVTRQAMEGYRPGCYIRLTFTDMPCELVNHFDPRMPILVGGLAQSEERFGLLQLRLKRHRWFPKILKNRDPLVFSIGWRRFQSVPVYALEDRNGRHRLLKYTPEHMHCLAVIYGPLSPPNTGVLAVQNLSSSHAKWRVSATGVVLQLDASFKVMKKLKLVGSPFKIHRHTAFVKGMFNSQVEAAKFEGAAVRTVSGIRGTIKRALRAGVHGGTDGSFRATMEDKPLISDIVFLRAWVEVESPNFYNTVTNLLGPQKVVVREEKPGRRKGDNSTTPQETGAAPPATSAPNGTTARDVEFQPSLKFTGARAGWVFKLGASGLGYYKDNVANAAPPPPVSAPATGELPSGGRGGIAGSSSLEGGDVGWVGMRTVGQMRREEGIGAPRKSDSLYRPIERAPRKFNPLRVPKSLQAALPFKTKPKLESKRKKPTLDQRRAVVLEPAERKAVTLVQQLNAIRNKKAVKRRAQAARHAQERVKKAAAEEAWRQQYNKQERKKRYVEAGHAEKKSKKQKS